MGPHSERNLQSLIALVVSVILILLLGYYYNEPFVTDSSFDSARVFLYILVPVLLNQFYFRIPWADLGIRRPKISKRMRSFIIIAVALIPLVIFSIRLSTDYLSAYSYYRNQLVHPFTRFNHFFIFTLSTLIGWEFLLRGYLFFGLRFILETKHRVEENLASVLAILWVCTFEVVYHFVKPDLEALGMLILSPILSWIAYKTKSLVVPLALHFYIEIVFILIVIYS